MAREQDALNRPTTSASTSAPSYSSGTSSDAIRQDIAQTRSNMDRTVDALGNRLQPRHILDEVLDYFGSKGSSAAGTGQALRDGAGGLLERVKEHPMPALMIGAGVAWLLFEGDKPSRSGRAANYDYARGGDVGDWRNLPERGGHVVDARTGQPYDEASYAAGYSGTSSSGGGGGAPAGPGIGERASGALSSAGSAIGGATSSVTGALGSAASAVKGAVAGAAGSTSQAASGLAGSAGQYARGFGSSAAGYGRGGYDMAGRGYSTATRSVGQAMEEYPLISGVAALALGAVAGLLLPATRRENELMGEYADQLKDQAQHVGSELLDRGKAVAGAAGSAASGAASDRGAAPGSFGEKARHVLDDVVGAAAQSAGKLMDDVKQVAADATAAATESAKREGLTPAQLKETAKDVAAKTAEAAKSEADKQRNKPL